MKNLYEKIQKEEEDRAKDESEFSSFYKSRLRSILAKHGVHNEVL